jgi:hypothetical protein
VYLGLIVVAGTMPSLEGASTGSGIAGIAPFTAAVSTTGLTTPESLGAKAAALTASGSVPFAYADGN